MIHVYMFKTFQKLLMSHIMGYLIAKVHIHYQEILPLQYAHLC